MGIFCFNLDKDDDAHARPDNYGSKSYNKRNPSRLVKKPSTSSHRTNPHHHHHPPTAALMASHARDMESAELMITAQESVIEQHIQNAGPKAFKYQRHTPLYRRTRQGLASLNFKGQSDYEAQREQLLNREKAMAYDFHLTSNGSDKEDYVNDILQALKEMDRELYKLEPARDDGFGGQKHARFAGDHFLSNTEIIGRTSLFRIAKWLPKGAHLHIHFNSCLLPEVLLNIAESMDRMFIRSTIPLVEASNPNAFEQCEIQFSIRGVGKENVGNLFDTKYDKETQEMSFKDFLTEFPTHYKKKEPRRWLQEKLVFTDGEAHNVAQTVLGAWNKFNGRTRMLKGLFNYETAYRRYTRLLLEDFVKDNIQYAEIRPNFMPTNQVWLDDGSKQVDNRGIMKMIMEEYETFQKKTDGYFGGMKIIYCTPRSFNREQVEFALAECLAFKKEWPTWIAGFDLVGEEGQGHPLRFFVPQFLAFRDNCAREDVKIPFLFHCGETLEMGDDTDGNLLDALLLNSRRIGHGFALARHPYVMEQMKLRGVCLEVCPISNEVLGLTPRMNGHSMYNLLANDVHCTISSDNGTLFGSTLSHDFYQFMVGKQDTSLYGWKQLILWSLEHACMEPGEQVEVRAKWETLWDTFLDKVIKEYPDVVERYGKAPADSDKAKGV